MAQDHDQAKHLVDGRPIHCFRPRRRLGLAIPRLGVGQANEDLAPHVLDLAKQGAPVPLQSGIHKVGVVLNLMRANQGAQVVLAPTIPTGCVM